jgi:hypothetical protein
MTARALKLVPPADQPEPEAILRDAIRDRDEAARTIAECDRIIAEHGRAYVRSKGEFMAPTIERLRRDLRP